jgi:hypothetical protein
VEIRFLYCHSRQAKGVDVLKRYHFPVAALIIAGALLLSGCGSKTKLCCNEIDDSFENSNRSYCIDHTIAVRLYIQEPADETEQLARLEKFKLFFSMAELCTALECLDGAVDTTTVVPEFKQFYVDEHGKAENELDVDEAEKTDLVKCGFRHAIEAGVQ